MAKQPYWNPRRDFRNELVGDYYTGNFFQGENQLWSGAIPIAGFKKEKETNNSNPPKLWFEWEWKEEKTILDLFVCIDSWSQSAKPFLRKRNSLNDPWIDAGVSEYVGSIPTATGELGLCHYWPCSVGKNRYQDQDPYKYWSFWLPDDDGKWARIHLCSGIDTCIKMRTLEYPQPPSPVFTFKGQGRITFDWLDIKKEIL